MQQRGCALFASDLHQTLGGQSEFFAYLRQPPSDASRSFPYRRHSFPGSAFLYFSILADLNQSVRDIGCICNVVAFKNSFSFVSGYRHRYSAGHTSANQITRRCGSPKLCPTTISTGYRVAVHRRNAVANPDGRRHSVIRRRNPASPPHSSQTTAREPGSSPADRGAQAKAYPAKAGSPR